MLLSVSQKEGQLAHPAASARSVIAHRSKLPWLAATNTLQHNRVYEMQLVFHPGGRDDLGLPIVGGRKE